MSYVDRVTFVIVGSVAAGALAAVAAVALDRPWLALGAWVCWMGPVVWPEPVDRH